MIDLRSDTVACPTPAMRRVMAMLAEMVCSNSFGGEGETNAQGLLQAEVLAAGGLEQVRALAPLS